MRLIFSGFSLFVVVTSYGQADWVGNYSLHQGYPKRMPEEARKSLWSKIEIFGDSLNNKLIWKYSKKDFSNFCIMSGYARKTGNTMELFFERYDTCNLRVKTSPEVSTPYLILKEEDEKYFVSYAQSINPKYLFITKRKTNIQ